MSFDKKNWLAQTKKECRLLPFITNYYLNSLGLSITSSLTSGELISLATIKSTEEFNLPAYIPLMDLTIEAECFNVMMLYHIKTLPSVIAPISIDYLLEKQVPNLKTSRYLAHLDATRRLAQKNDLPVINFVSGPFTLLCQVLSFNKVKELLQHPGTLEKCLVIVSEFLINYIEDLKTNGSNGFIICEPSLQFLSSMQITSFATRHIANIKQSQPEMLFGFHSCIDDIDKLNLTILKLEPDLVSVGNEGDLTKVFDFVLTSSLVIGNLSPVKTFVKNDANDARIAIEKEAARYKAFPNFIGGFSCVLPFNSKQANIAMIRSLTVKDTN
ncbi:MAG: uroporphyrinogen decarboxylase family protein [Erysipelotrichaceae bacterium]|nr:uroporphyrinogen decarboxylase family protein [Erysipelotrichaceae bacterium]MDD3809025.1 uroporphyrinogen decarboxylase family protein [Erysipelotrichaceae bacterium]